MTFTILPLKEKDAEELAALEKSCFSSAWTETQYRELLAKASRAWSGFQGGANLPAWAGWGISIPGPGLVAYVSLGVYSAASEMEILNIAVQKECRRQGLGRALLRHALEWARARSLERALLEVREGNDAALALYKEAGFCLAGRRGKYYADTGEDALVLCCDIQSRPWLKSGLCP